MNPSKLYQWQESFTWEEIVGSNDKTIGSSFFPFVSILSQRLRRMLLPTYLLLQAVRLH